MAAEIDPTVADMVNITLDVTPLLSLVDPAWLGPLSSWALVALTYCGLRRKRDL